jgi:hypothetical protein
LADALALDTDGTQYVKPADKQILLPIITTRSDHVDHLQLADLVAAATTALIAGAPAANPYKELIYKLLAKNYRGYVGGTGLKFIPSAAFNPRARTRTSSLRPPAPWAPCYPTSNGSSRAAVVSVTRTPLRHSSELSASCPKATGLAFPARAAVNGGC